MSPATSPAKTTQARLQAVINQSRQIMRKDAGLNGELDRLPQLAWLLFLKAFDDLEEEREALEEGYRPVLPEELRWRTWASGSDTTGDPLLVFVNGRLLPKLRSLQGSGRPGDPRDTLARVFQDTTNRMLSGHLLRQLVNQVNKVEFSHRDEMHAMAVFYETMLREMRDAAGDSGEFYTPRPLIRFIVEQVDPRPGETVLDPAAGTGGFLIEAYKHMTAGNVSASEVEQVKAGLRGIEKIYGQNAPENAQVNEATETRLPEGAEDIPIINDHHLGKDNLFEHVRGSLRQNREGRLGELIDGLFHLSLKRER